MDWLTDQTYRLRRASLKRAPLIVACLTTAYFGYHAMHGDRGLYAWMDTSRLIEERRAELAELRDRRAALERRVDALKPEHSQADLLSEELLKLGFVWPSDVIIYRSDFDSE